MLTRYIKQAVVILIITGLFVGVSLACGPFLQDRVLEQGDDYIIKPPEGMFSREIEIIKQTLDSYFSEANSGYKQLLKYKAKELYRTEKADVNDLKDALGNLNISNVKFQSTLQEYEKIRHSITEYLSARNNWEWRKKYRKSSFDENKTPYPELKLPRIPAELPGEFEDYLHGALFYHQNQKDKAKSVWKKLLQRPVEQRKYRSTWAAFMIGRILVDDKPEESKKWFELTRELSDKGFEDSLGLAAASIGWQAKAELNQKYYVQAIELYMIQLASGDRSAMPSIQTVCTHLLQAELKSQIKAAENPLSRKVVNAYILSRGGPFHEVPSSGPTRTWLEAIEAAKVDNMEEAGRFAWTAYSIGDTAAAEKWIEKAPHNDIMANWINVKLLLQQGNIVEAIKLLVHVSRTVAPEGEMLEYNKYDERYYSSYSDFSFIKTIRGELGSLYLSQKNYVEALDTLIRGAYWEDAAYIAERLLTIDELKAYIDKTWPDSSKDDSSETMSLPDRLRFLFARRLARMDKWNEARPYYPLKWQNKMDVYIEALKEGNSGNLSKKNRASALWKAAVIARNEGMELMGTELEMDWFLYNGNAYRRNIMPDVREKMLSNKVASSSKNEIQRTKQTIPSDKRFHYRYIATELAWQAAELMPDNSEQTASVLCIAGSWIKAKDPKGADKFYKALVNRNRKTKLGQEADKLRWFPPVTTDLFKEANGGS